MKHIDDDKTTAKLRAQRNKYAEKLKCLDENLKLRDAKKAEVERKARTKRLIEIGATVENSFEINIEKDELPVFINFLVKYKNTYITMRENNMSTPKKEERGVNITHPLEQEEKIYLAVPIEEKDVAKALGAKWDAEKIEWYTFSNNPNKAELLKKWKKIF